MTRRLLLALLLAAGPALAPAHGQQTASPDDVAPADPAELLESSLRYSKGLRVQLSGRARQRIDAFGARLVGTRWVGDFGLGSFDTVTIPSGDELLVFTLDGWRLPFVPLDTPERWLIATGVYTTSGTADVTFETDADGAPLSMSWLDDYTFAIVDDDAFAMTPDEIDAGVAALVEALDRLWLDRDAVAAAQSALLARGVAYRAIDDAEPLAARLATDLRVVLQDDLASARFVPLAREVTTWDDDGEPDEDEATDDERRAVARDYRGGLGNVERAEGGVGYIEVQAFLPGDLAADAYADALDRLGDVEALMIDVRSARGGHPTGARRLAAHLVDPGTPLVTVEVPADAERTEVLAEDVGDAPTFRDKPVFVLVGPRTMGAAEEFAAALQALGVARIVGEPTAGVAHLTRRAMITPHLEVVIPSQRTTTPDGGSWHGTGVTPDVVTPASQAGAVAWRAATEALGR